MSTFPLTTVTLQGGVDAALALIPTAPGVGQILAAADRNLVIGRPSNLRRWAAAGTPGALDPLESVGAGVSHLQRQDLCFPVSRSERDANPNF